MEERGKERGRRELRPPYKNQDKSFYSIGLTLLDGIGPVHCRKLVGHLGSAEEVFRTSKKDLKLIPGIGDKLAHFISSGKVLGEAEREVLFAEKNGVRVIGFDDADYPWMLKEVHDAPFVLYQKGAVSLNDTINVAIVGTRKPSGYGRMLAADFGKYLSERGINVVSGLAYGIDGAAHGGALEKGMTTAVLGHGLQTIYPREHYWKAHEISSRGALLTEFNSVTGPDGRNFPMRNRIISGLCHATVVIEAREKGGALITARSAFDQNREVYAVPGDLRREQSAGCNILIREQVAKLLTHPEQILDDIAPMLQRQYVKPDKKSPPASVKMSREEFQVMEALRCEEGSLGDLSERMIFSVNTLQGLMVGLEIKGMVFREPSGIYRCV